LFLLLLVAGCEDRGLDEARKEAVSARAEAERLKFNLEKARQEISELKAELHAVRQSRDELQESVAQLVQERDEALTYAAEAQDSVVALTSRAQGQISATAALEQEIAQLRDLVEEQQALLEQLQKGEAAAPPAEAIPDVLPDDSIPPEPNTTP